jgi:signal transduction histidine kinase
MKWTTIGSRIGVGYMMMIGLLAFTIGVTIWQTGRLSERNRQIRTVNTPSIHAAYNLINGINHSMASLRGWIILGDESLKDRRNTAWETEIHPALNRLRELAIQWPDPENAKMLDQLDAQLKQFEKHQNDIESMAHTPENTPALQLLRTDAIPEAENMLKNAESLIEKERQYESSARRKELLVHLAECQGALGSALVALRTYLITGENESRTRFETLWAEMDDSLEQIESSKTLLSRVQWNALRNLTATRNSFDRIQKQMIQMRSGPDWNKAEALLRDKAAPLAGTIQSIARDIVAAGEKRETDAMGQSERMTRILYQVEWFLLAIGVIFGCVLWLNTTRAIGQPIANAAEMARAVADDNDLAHFNPTQIDELQKLGTALEEMRDKIQAHKAELEQAHEKEVILNRTKSTILQSTSNAMRTPINAVIGFSNVLNDEISGPLNPEQKENVQRIIRAGEYSLRMLNDLLDLSKIESNRLELSPEPCDLAELARKSLETVKPDADRKNLPCLLHLEDEPLMNRVDPVYIGKILRRLLNNAVKYTEDGQVDVTVKREGEQHVIAIRDSGIGMDKATSSLIFERFEKIVDEDAPRARESSGLGVMLSRKLAKLHQGDISVESDKGKGSTFTLTLPINDPDA